MTQSFVIGLGMFLLLCVSSTFSRCEIPLKKGDTAVSDGDTVQIDKIFIIGHKKTKEHIIRRELSIHDGQQISRLELQEILLADKRKLINTRLFLNVNINIIDLTDEKIDIIIRVEERWYFFPIPIFELADRNFTEWWVNQKADFSRVEWGIKLRHFNFRGRREILNITAQFGFTKLFRLAYQFPYIDKKQKLGVSFYGDYATNKNIAVRTIGHRQQFLDSESVVRDRWRGGVSLRYRPNFYSSHSFGLHYSSVTVSDSIPELNPNYFNNGSKYQRYFALSYNFIWDFRDFIAYPLSGAYFQIAADKIGLGIYGDIDILNINARYSRYFDLGKKFYYGSGIIGNFSTPSEQPYYNVVGVGFEKNFMRGYERYVIEGPHFIIHKNSFRRLIFAYEADISNAVKLKQFSKIPVSAYFTLNFDHGYVVNYPNYSENELFTGRYIYGGGVGIDIISFYDFVMRWEYSMNIEGEHALYFNLYAAF
ncbi:MAG: BamA/TamA family outer membrane protein [Cytophagales bacterium]|nr:BamA/TamA family outer membrane protein [Cytophagales bacterium]